jgi:hypothetical protein
MQPNQTAAAPKRSTTFFSPEIRVLLCTHCGAPIEAAIAGGQAACRYCGAAHQLAQRDARRLTFIAPGQPPMSEEERFARLRAQDGRPLLPPASLQSLLPDGQLPSWRVQEAFAVWQSTRQELRTSASYEAAERLLFLTLILSSHFLEQNDLTRQRAMLESALEAFSLPRHRQIMLGCLSRNACRTGDLQAAEQWLAPCDPRSDNLESESDYRFARAFLDTARGDWAAVLRVLGNGPEDIPIMDADEPACAVLRANAWERLGHLATAVHQLKHILQKMGAQGQRTIEKIISLHPTWHLCAHSFPQANATHSAQAAGNLAQLSGGMLANVFIPLGGLFVLMAIGCLLGIIVAIATGEYSWIIGLGSTLVVMAPMGLGLVGMGLKARKEAEKAAHLRLHGLRATGRVQDVTPTGTTVNGVPEALLRLLVEIPGTAPYQATVKMLLPPAQLATLPGSAVPVRVDPQNPSDLVLETQ